MNIVLKIDTNNFKLLSQVRCAACNCLRHKLLFGYFANDVLLTELADLKFVCPDCGSKGDFYIYQTCDLSQKV